MSCIYGIGTDIVAVVRLESMFARQGERALRRLLALEEIEECRQYPQPGRFLAKRFAAKEAFAKAIGLGVRAPAVLPAIRITHDGLGKPRLAYNATLSAWMAERRLTAHLSISDEQTHVLAFVVVEQLTTPPESLKP